MTQPLLLPEFRLKVHTNIWGLVSVVC